MIYRAISTHKGTEIMFNLIILVLALIGAAALCSLIVVAAEVIRRAKRGREA